ncbi:MAG: hypothetical protein ACYCSN_20720, partial [Acidobacteriaceae bacterium]
PTDPVTDTTARLAIVAPAASTTFTRLRDIPSPSAPSDSSSLEVCGEHYLIEDTNSGAPREPSGNGR